LIIITAIIFFGFWGIFLFLHAFRLISLDGFSLNSFKAGHSRIVISDYNSDLEKVKIHLESSEFIFRDIKFKKHIMITIKRGLFQFVSRDIFYKFRTVIDYSSSDKVEVSIHWDNHWIFQSYIFLMLIPALLLSASEDIILYSLVIILPAIVHYYCMHKVEHKKVSRYEKKMLELLNK